MSKAAGTGRVGIMHDESEGFHAGWRILPAQLGRNVVAFTGELARNVAFRLKR